MSFRVELPDRRNRKFFDRFGVLLLDPARVILGQADHFLQGLVVLLFGLSDGVVFESMIPFFLVQIEEHILFIFVFAVVDDHRVVVLVQSTEI